MKLTRLWTLAPFLAVLNAQDISIAGVKQAFADANIPNDLKITFNPKFLLEVILPQSTGAPILIHSGIQLPRNNTAILPRFNFIDPFKVTTPISAGLGPFVIAAVDPDAPTPENPTIAQVRHLLAGNYAPRLKSGYMTTSLLTNSTAAVSEWVQPTPRGGNHRYVFLAFNQPPGFNQQTLVTAATPIFNFDIAQFAQAVGLGDPIAGTFMMVANPDNP